MLRIVVYDAMKKGEWSDVLLDAEVGNSAEQSVWKETK